MKDPFGMESGDLPLTVPQSYRDFPANGLSYRSQPELPLVKSNGCPFTAEISGSISAMSTSNKNSSYNGAQKILFTLYTTSQKYKQIHIVLHNFSYMTVRSGISSHNHKTGIWDFQSYKKYPNQTLPTN